MLAKTVEQTKMAETYEHFGGSIVFVVDQNAPPLYRQLGLIEA